MAHACNPRNLRQEDCHEFQARICYTGWLQVPKNKTEERKERRMDGRRKERRKGVREGIKKTKGLATYKQKQVDIELYEPSSKPARAA